MTKTKNKFKYISIPFRLLEITDIFRYNKKWYMKITRSGAVTCDKPEKYISLAANSIIGLSILDISESKIKTIKYYLR